MNLKSKAIFISTIALALSINLISVNASNSLTKDDIDRLEKQFSENDYKGDIDENIIKETKGYYYKEGKIPILISAPHSLKQPPREDTKGDYKLADKFTGAIAKELAKRTGAHVIYKTGYTGIDENYPLDEKGNLKVETDYRKEIKNIIAENEIKLVIDLHAFKADDTRDYGIEIGTNSGKNFVGNRDILNSILTGFKKGGFEESSSVKKSQRIVIDKEFKAAAENRSVSNYVATTLRTPAIQIEISSENRNTDDMVKFNKTVDALEKVIIEANKYEKIANVVGSEQVYFRSKAKFDESNIIGEINKGEAVTILSQYSESFYRVKYNGKIGYASNKYLQERGIIYGVDNHVNVRKTANDGDKNGDTINVGESVTIIERGEYWTKVKYGDKGNVGYISSKYVFVGERAKICNVTLHVNFRVNPDIDSNVFSKCPTIGVGETVNIIEQGKGWTKVEYKGHTGYVSPKFLETTL